MSLSMSTATIPQVVTEPINRLVDMHIRKNEIAGKYTYSTYKFSIYIT